MKLYYFLIIGLLLSTNIFSQGSAQTASSELSLEDGILLPRFITSNMVVQRDRPIKIWGWAAPGEVVTGVFAGNDNISYDTVSVDLSGKWNMIFPAREATADPCMISLAIKGLENTRLELNNILVGDVWFAGGQSNMEKKVSHLLEAAEVIAASNQYPLIRSFKSSYQMSETPLDEVGDNSIGWFECNSETTGENVSAVAYIFALNIHLEEKIPVGIIQAYRGGTEIETWISQEKIQNDYELFRLRERMDLMDPNAADAYKNYPSIHFNGQVHPFISTPLKGFIFYQGESNTKRGLEYGDMMKALIEDWRSLWDLGDLPLYYVQLFNMGIASSTLYEEGNWQDTRDQQLRLLNSDIKNIGMAVSIDTNEDPNNSDPSIRIHPKNKKPIGERLALQALEHTYHKDTLGSSPVPLQSYIRDDTVYIVFDNTGTSLQPASSGEEFRGFVVAGEDKVFFEASAILFNDSTLAISSASVNVPVAARYAWSKNPDCNLVNSAGLPASPFRTDDWPSGYNYTDSGDKNDADLFGIIVNGVPLSNFNNSTLNRVVDFPESLSSAEVIPVPVSIWATTDVFQPENIKGTVAERTATIIVRSYDGTQERIFTLLFNSVPALDLYFALGQSNMAGRAPMTDYTSEIIPGVRLFDDLNNWTIAMNPMNLYSNIRKDVSMQQVGPSYAFVKTVSEYTDSNIGIAVNARGGEAITAFVRGEYHDPMFERLKETKKFGEVKGIIWHQGESDNSMADVYMSDLEILVAELRAEFGNACFVAGQLGGWNAEGGGIPKHKAFNDTISHISNYIYNSDYVSNEKLGHLGDFTHFNLGSQILIGQRYAQKILSTIYNVDITIVNIDMNGSGMAVYQKDSVFYDMSYSYTALKGSDQFIEIYPSQDMIITSLIINGTEVSEAVGEASYTYDLNTDTDSDLSIQLTSGFPQNIFRNLTAKNSFNAYIYPNPTSDFLNISLPDSSYKIFEVFNLVGQVVMKRTIDKNMMQVNVSDLDEGLYTISFTGSTGKCLARFVRE